MTAVPASERFTGDMARQYDERTRVNVPGYDLMHQLVAASLGANLDDEAHLLIVGAGTGTELLHLGKHPGWRFTAVDPAPEMLAIARERCATAGLSDRVEFVPTTTDQLPAASRYDAATAILVMQFLADDGAKAGFLQSISDRLRPGATLVLVDLHGDVASDQFARITGIWRSYLRDRGLPDEMIDRMDQQVLANLHWVSESRQHDLLTGAGFVDIDLIYRWLRFGCWSMRKADVES